MAGELNEPRGSALTRSVASRVLAAAVDAGDLAVFAHLFGKIIFSGFLGGTIAALSGIVPSRAKDDLARAVHRTLLWSVLAVIACQCFFVIAVFRP